MSLQSVWFHYFSDIGFNIYYDFLKNDFSENHNAKINVQMIFSKFHCHFLGTDDKNLNEFIRCVNNFFITL